MRKIHVAAGAIPAPAPDFDTLPPDPEHPGARLDCAKPTENVQSGATRFKDVRSVAVDVGRLVLGTVPGRNPVVFTPTPPVRPERINAQFAVGRALHERLARALL